MYGGSSRHVSSEHQARAKEAAAAIALARQQAVGTAAGTAKHLAKGPATRPYLGARTVTPGLAAPAAPAGPAGPAGKAVIVPAGPLLAASGLITRAKSLLHTLQATMAELEDANAGRMPVPAPAMPAMLALPAPLALPALPAPLAPPAPPVCTSGCTSRWVVRLAPSDLASYVGKDPCVSREAALLKLWIKTCEASFYGAYDAWRRKMKGDVQKTRALPRFASMGQVGEVETFSLLEKTLGSGESIQYRNAGIWWEPSTNQGGFMGKACASGELPTQKITDPGPFIFVGEMDGAIVTPSQGIIPVEVKTRQTPKTFHRACAEPVKDVLQLQTYMMAIKCPKGYLVNRQQGTLHCDIKEVGIDSVEWNGILSALLEFVCDFRMLLRGAAVDIPLRERVFMYFTHKRQCVPHADTMSRASDDGSLDAVPPSSLDAVPPSSLQRIPHQCLEAVIAHVSIGILPPPPVHHHLQVSPVKVLKPVGKARRDPVVLESCLHKEFLESHRITRQMARGIHLKMF